MAFLHQRAGRWSLRGKARQVSTQGPSWGYFKSQFQSGLSAFDNNFPKMAPITRQSEAGITPRRAFCGGGIADTLDTTPGQIDGFFSQLPLKCYLPELASVGDLLKICPWVASGEKRRILLVLCSL